MRRVLGQIATSCAHTEYGAAAWGGSGAERAQAPPLMALADARRAAGGGGGGQARTVWGGHTLWGTVISCAAEGRSRGGYRGTGGRGWQCGAEDASEGEEQNRSGGFCPSLSLFLCVCVSVSVCM